MEGLKQILGWVSYCLIGLIGLPLVVVIACVLSDSFAIYLPYICVAYLLVFILVATTLVICLVGVQNRLYHNKMFEMQQKALNYKYDKESKRITERLAIEQEKELRKRDLEDKKREHELKIEAEDRARKWRLEDEKREHELKTEAEDRANLKSKETK